MGYFQGKVLITSYLTFIAVEKRVSWGEVLHRFSPFFEQLRGFMSTSREDHLRECKQRAIEYAERGELTDALASFWSDLSKHPGTADTSKALFLIGIFIVKEQDKNQMIEYINGFR